MSALPYFVAQAPEIQERDGMFVISFGDLEYAMSFHTLTALGETARIVAMRRHDAAVVPMPKHRKRG